jgi:hypothetical protein
VLLDKGAKVNQPTHYKTALMPPRVKVTLTLFNCYSQEARK